MAWAAGLRCWVPSACARCARRSASLSSAVIERTFPSVNVQRLHGVVGRDAEFVYLATIWLPELVEVRAGGLIPIARQYPGAREFVESSKKEFRGASISANAYGACQILVE